jgi:hypothetical protein
MGLISNLFKKLFGNSQRQSQTPPQTNMGYMDRWELERQKRIADAERQLKDWILVMLREKGSLPFSWESGNDEAFLTFEDVNDTERDHFEDLEMYMIDKLNIPDAGEFKMNGSGMIYMENGFARVKYSSIIKITIDFNEETEEEVFGEEEEDSRDIALF